MVVIPWEIFHRNDDISKCDVWIDGRNVGQIDYSAAITMTDALRTTQISPNTNIDRSIDSYNAELEYLDTIGQDWHYMPTEDFYFPLLSEWATIPEFLERFRT